MKVMTKNTVSTTNLLGSVFKEEGIDLTLFQDKKKLQNKKKVKMGNTFKAIFESFKQAGDWWIDKVHPVSVFMYLLFWVLSSVITLAVAGADLIPGLDVEPGMLGFLEFLHLTSFITTLPIVIHTSLVFFKNKKDRSKEEGMTKSDQEDGVQVIFSSLNSYIEAKREEVIHRISQEKAGLEEEVSLLNAEISNLEGLIKDSSASGELKQKLTESRADLEQQVDKAQNEIEDLGKFRTKINKSIDFLVKNQSPKVSWSLRSIEALQRSSTRVQQSEMIIEESRQLVQDITYDFARFWGVVTGKLEQVNNITGTKLTTSREVMNLSEFDKFLPEEAA